MNAAAKAYGERLRRANPTKSSFQAKRDARANTKIGERSTQVGRVTERKVKNEAADTQVDANTTGKTEEERQEVENPEKAAPTKEVIDNEPSVQAHTVSTAKPEGALAYFWKAEEQYDMEQNTRQASNFYTPNSRAMYELVNKCLKLLQENAMIKKHHPEFLPYSMYVYFALLFHLQILRARRASMLITTNETKFLTQFEKFYDYAELCFPEVFKPYFEAIVSTELSTTKFGWISPQIADNFYYQGLTLADYLKNRDDFNGMLQPHIPTLVSVLRSMTSETASERLFETEKLGQDDIGIHAHDNGEWIHSNLFDKDHDKMQFNGVPLHKGANELILSSQGLHIRSYTFGDHIAQAAPKWKESDFNTIINFMSLKAYGDEDDTDPTQRKFRSERKIQKAGAKPLNTIFDFMCWDQDRPNKWIQDIINQADIFCRFFSKIKISNLGEVQTTGSYEPTIIARYNFVGGKKAWGKRSMGQQTHEEHDLDGYVKKIDDWFVDPLSMAKVSFFTSRYGFERGHVIIAMAFAVNAVLPIKRKVTDVTNYPRKTQQDNDKESKMLFRVGGPGELAYSKNAKASGDMIGPFWEEGDWSFTYGHADGQGKEMFVKFEEIVKDHYFAIKPAFYSGN